MSERERVKAHAEARLRYQHKGDGLAYITRYQDEAIVRVCDALEAAEQERDVVPGHTWKAESRHVQEQFSRLFHEKKDLERAVEEAKRENERLRSEAARRELKGER